MVVCNTLDTFPFLAVHMGQTETESVRVVATHTYSMKNSI